MGMRLIFLIICCCFLGKKVIGQVEIYTFGDQIRRSERIELLEINEGKYRIRIGDDLLNPSHIDSIKSGKNLFVYSSRIKTIRSNPNKQKFFYPLKKKYPHIWIYGDHLASNELSASHKDLRSPGDFYSKAGGPPKAVNLLNLKDDYPNSKEGRRYLTLGLVMNRSGKNLGLIGLGCTVLPLIYLLPNSRNFQSREFLLLSAIPTSLLLVGVSVRISGKKKLERGYKLLKD